MKKLFASFICLLTFASSVYAANIAKVGDAYVNKNDKAGTSWTIGTSGIAVDYKIKNGSFLITNLTNKCTKPAVSYITPKNPVSVFDNPMSSSGENYSKKVLWNATLQANKSTQSHKIAVDVKKGDKIAFITDSAGDTSSDQTDWETTITYADGATNSSDISTSLNQGKTWYYYLNIPGTDNFIQMDDTIASLDNKGTFRVPSAKSGYRSEGSFEPHVSGKYLHPTTSANAVRIWVAPKDGKVTITGEADAFRGGTVKASIAKLGPASKIKDTWSLVASSASKTKIGGVDAVRLDITLKKDNLLARYHVFAHPGTSVLRQKVDVENLSSAQDVSLVPVKNLLTLGIDGTKDSFTNMWMSAETVDTSQGKIYKNKVINGFKDRISTIATANIVPWMAVKRDVKSQDGLYIAPDYLGHWSISIERSKNGTIRLCSGCEDLPALKVGKKLSLPYMTFGVFTKSLDNMARDLYNWQYTYLWDYTHEDYFTKMPATVAWYGSSLNLQQQWAGHLSDLDMASTNFIRTVGMEQLWIDAGWSATSRWWHASFFEGPDFFLTRKYLDKSGIKLLVWMQGHVSNGVLSAKQAAWGNYQRRTDGMHMDHAHDAILRNTTEKFLNDHPRCSFHTCSGGSNYAHTFEIQRYTDVNYDADGPGAPYTNAYWSYIEVPEKWFDNFCLWGKYDETVGFRYLTQVPKWGCSTDPDSMPPMRHVCDLYHYMLDCGVAGRWSYIVHPVIVGDADYHYCQRVNYNGSKSMIIFKHFPEKPVKIYPTGLISNMTYIVDFEAGSESYKRTGRDLMKNGISFEKPRVGEIVYLNMPNRPGSGRDNIAPTAPPTVLAKYEVNIENSGIGIYWSRAKDNNWISCYEVKRGDEIIGTVSTGHYYFDKSYGFGEHNDYYVRTIDGDGNLSPWTKAKFMPSETKTYATLGGLFNKQGHEGWSAETSEDGVNFVEMKWVEPVRSPTADIGGTTIQEGGAEGYWEGADTARIGRGWQQASLSAYCSRTWTAIRGGKISIVGRPTKDYYRWEFGNPIKVKITHNNKDVWTWQTLELNDELGKQHMLTLDIKVGDKIRFIVDKASDVDNDLVAWMPTIRYINSAQQPVKQSVVRILCGSGKDYTDNTGVKWSADKYYTGGKAIKATAKLVKGLQIVDDAKLYRTARSGKNFTYSIPVEDGMYCIRLKFIEPKYNNFFNRPFTMTVNGKKELVNFDVNQAARGKDKPFDRLVRYVVPNAEGKIVLNFSGGWEPSMLSDEAIISAIEVTPETKNDIIRVNAGSNKDFVDWNGNIWLGDSAFVSGGSAVSGRGNLNRIPTVYNTDYCAVQTREFEISQASPTLFDQEIYRTARSGNMFTYTFTVPDRLYSIQLKFAELWSDKLGERPMDIYINNKLIWKDYDPATRAMKINKAADMRVDDIIPDKNNQIVIKVVAKSANAAILQGIQID